MEAFVNGMIVGAVVYVFILALVAIALHFTGE